jgi:caffeoyl-CoA O-methyltransferase
MVGHRLPTEWAPRPNRAEWPREADRFRPEGYLGPAAVFRPSGGGREVRPQVHSLAVPDPRPPKSFQLSAEVHDYLVAHTDPIDDVQKWQIERTRELGPVAGMQISPEQGALLTMLVRLIAATSVVEVGTFTGYSSTCLARGLAPGGHLLCCDVSDEWTSIARQGWKRAGVEDRIELQLAPATQTLEALPDAATIDFSFIDADKSGYLSYYEALLPRTRVGGLIAVDNVLWSGRVVDATVTDTDTEAIRAFNDHVVADDRVETVMLPIADGLTLLRKRGA